MSADRCARRCRRRRGRQTRRQEDHHQQHPARRAATRPSRSSVCTVDRSRRAPRRGQRHVCDARRRPAHSCCAPRARDRDRMPRSVAAIATALALTDLDSTDAADARCDAIDTLAAAILIRRCATACTALPQPRRGYACRCNSARRGPARAVQRSKPNCSSTHLTETVFFGLSLGSVLLLGGHRSRHHLRRHGRDQHGARRADDARRLHHLPRAAGNAAAIWSMSLLVAMPAAFLVAGAVRHR